jgi:hypothetical protein
MCSCAGGVAGGVDGKEVAKVDVCDLSGKCTDDEHEKELDGGIGDNSSSSYSTL